MCEFITGASSLFHHSVSFFFFLLVPCCFGYCSSLTNSCATDLRNQKPVGELGIELQINIRIEVSCFFCSWVYSKGCKHTLQHTFVSESYKWVWEAIWSFLPQARSMNAFSQSLLKWLVMAAYHGYLLFWIGARLTAPYLCMEFLVLAIVSV